MRARPLLVLAVSTLLASLMSFGRAAQVTQKIVLHVGDRGRLVLELGDLANSQKVLRNLFRLRTIAWKLSLTWKSNADFLLEVHYSASDLRRPATLNQAFLHART